MIMKKVLNNNLIYIYNKLEKNEEKEEKIEEKPKKVEKEEKKKLVEKPNKENEIKINEALFLAEEDVNI